MCQAPSGRDWTSDGATDIFTWDRLHRATLSSKESRVERGLVGGQGVGARGGRIGGGGHLYNTSIPWSEYGLLFIFNTCATTLRQTTVTKGKQCLHMLEASSAALYREGPVHSALHTLSVLAEFVEAL